jgi:uncharacterized protein
LRIHSFDGERIQRSAYIQAGLHADEHPGLLVVHHLERKLSSLAARDRLIGRVVLCPFANPVGLTQRIFGMPAGRFNLDNGENFNRLFPAIANEVHEILASATGEKYDVDRIKALFAQRVSARGEFDPVRATKRALLAEAFKHEIVLDLHCDTDSILHLYANRMHEERALRLARAMNVETVFMEDDAGGSPFDESYVHPWREAVRSGHVTQDDAGFCASIELRGQSDVDDILAERDAAGIVRFLCEEGLVESADEDDWREVPSVRAYPLEGASHVRTPVTGIIAYAKRPGDFVSLGERIADVVRLDVHADFARTPIISDVEGRFVVAQQFKLVRAGQRVALLAGTAPLPSRIPGSLLNDF